MAERPEWMLTIEPGQIVCMSLDAICRAQACKIADWLETRAVPCIRRDGGTVMALTIQDWDQFCREAKGEE